MRTRCDLYSPPKTAAQHKNNPFITFDTTYEDGRYVDFSRLCSSTISHREDALKMLIRRSISSSSIEVSVDDHLPLLITCVDDDEERGVIATRRIHENETQEQLNKQIKERQRSEYGISVSRCYTEKSVIPRFLQDPTYLNVWKEKTRYNTKNPTY